MKLIILAQIIAVCVNAYILSLERKYCGHCTWWCDAGAVIWVLINCIPVIGLFSAIIGCVDYVRNIINELIHPTLKL